jgi:anti-anti-sigma factor
VHELLDAALLGSRRAADRRASIARPTHRRRRTIVARGELDAVTAPELVDRLGDPSVDGVDLSGVTFIDAAGLAALVQATRARGGALLLRAPSTPVRRAIEVTGLGHVLAIADDPGSRPR